MATGILSKGITLGHAVAQVGPFVVLTDLQEIPDMGAEPEKVEVTTLSDTNRRYINGIKDFGDLNFKFLYDNAGATSSYRILKGYETAGTIAWFQVELPDETTFTFSAGVVCKIDSAGVNAPLTFTASLTLNSDMVIANPA